MTRRQTLKLASWFLGLALGAGSGSVFGQQAAPTENKGVTVKALVAVDLGPEIKGMGGRQLRMRMVTIDPGGVFGIHSHKDPSRPATDYMLQGSLIDHRGGVAKELRQGDTFSEDKRDTMHWLENKGTTPAVIIAVDVFKQP